MTAKALEMTAPTRAGRVTTRRDRAQLAGGLADPLACILGDEVRAGVHVEGNSSS
jgi:hypothetical protein